MDSNAFEHVFRDFTKFFSLGAYAPGVLHCENGNLWTSSQLQITLYLFKTEKNHIHVLAENCLSNGIKTNSPAAVGSEKTDFEVFQNMVKSHRVFEGQEFI